MAHDVSALRAKAKAHNQEHLFSFYDGLTEPSRKKLLDQISKIDFAELDKLVAEFVKGKLGSVDSIGWNALQINPGAEPGKSSSVAIPTKHDIVELDKTEMLKAV